MDEEIRRFLSALVDCGGCSAASGLKVVCSRKQDRARQAARKNGLVEFRTWKSHRAPRAMWHITDAGRAALAASMST